MSIGPILFPGARAALAAVFLFLSTSVLEAARDVKVVFRAPESGLQGLTGDSEIYDRSYAVVIGVNEYRSDSIPRLQGAVRDAREVAKALTEQGFETTVLLDGKATRSPLLPP